LMLFRRRVERDYRRPGYFYAARNLHKVRSAAVTAARARFLF
jgi:hypothetical protein